MLDMRKHATLVRVVEVTAEDIVAAQDMQCVAERCPIARALVRVVRRPVEVGPLDWLFLDDPERWPHDLPQNARKFVHDFDRSNAVQPFSFEIEA